jgi:hypothetical protein
MYRLIIERFRYFQLWFVSRKAEVNASQPGYGTSGEHENSSPLLSPKRYVLWISQALSDLGTKFVQRRSLSWLQPKVYIRHMSRPNYYTARSRVYEQWTFKKSGDWGHYQNREDWKIHTVCNLECCAFYYMSTARCTLISIKHTTTPNTCYISRRLQHHSRNPWTPCPHLQIPQESLER